MNTEKIPATIDEYISSYPDEIQDKLNQMRAAVKRAAPDAAEKISYRMPAFTQNGMLVYFAAHKNHIGFYPFTTVLKAFSKELTDFHTSKGGIQFPHKNQLPLDLINRIVEFRVKENLEKAALKKLKKAK